MMNTDVLPIWPTKKSAIQFETEPAPLSDHALAIAASGGDMARLKNFIYDIPVAFTRCVCE
jgi:hypothetical protein